MNFKRYFMLREDNISIKVQVWNVGHGDAIRIDFDNGLSVIRDFGRSEYFIATATSIDLDGLVNFPIVPKGRKTSAILSHAHEDHFNGFRKLYDSGHSNIFNECHIPWLDFRTVKSLGWQMGIVGAYLYAYFGPDTNAGKTTRNWYLAAPIMARLGERLYGVSAGYTFSWPVPNRVLWPASPVESLWWERRAELAAQTIKRIKQSLKKAKQSDFSAQIEKAANEICTILQKYYSKEQSSLSKEQHSVNVERINSILESIGNLHIPDTSALNEVFFRAARDRACDLDDHSLVFEISNRALFLSDLNATQMDRMASLYMQRRRRYRLIKSAHHGTRIGGREFKNAIEKADCILHCCGPTKNKNYKGPKHKYCYFAPERIISTDRHPAMEPVDKGINNFCFNSNHDCLEI
jgi:hypothetical protein